MSEKDNGVRVTSATLDVAAPCSVIFELIADPSQQPRWDGNENLDAADPGQRVYGVGQVFAMTNRGGRVRENHVVEFEEGRRIAWMPAEVGKPPIGQLWRWELEEVEPGRTRVTHTYDWAQLKDESRLERARATTSERLMASVERLAALAESS